MTTPSPPLWGIRLTAEEAHAEAFEEALGEIALSVARFEAKGAREDAPVLWRLQATCDAEPDLAALALRLAAAAGRAGAEMPDFHVEKLPDVDWLALNRSQFPPIAAGRFFIHGSHFEGAPPAGKVVLRLDAGPAFGSGTHETTRGCLLAIDGLLEEGERTLQTGNAPLTPSSSSGVTTPPLTQLRVGSLSLANPSQPSPPTGGRGKVLTAVDHAPPNNPLPPIGGRGKGEGGVDPTHGSARRARDGSGPSTAPPPASAPPAPRVLDLGCGSGILALAVAKALAVPVVASDVDPIAAETAQANARANGLGDLVTAVAEDGVGEAVRARGPYDLVCANILAEPLVRMAGDVAAVAAPGGRLILSGLLARQEQEVMAAYAAEGFTRVRAIVLGDWATLVLERKARAR